MSRVLGSALAGVDGVCIEVEVRISSQLPRIDIVGLPEAAVREAAARVRAAIASAGHPFPDRRVTVNLAPAGIRKSGAGLDLAIALGVLGAAGAVEPASLQGVGLLGELALDGRIRAVRGALPQAMALCEAGCRRILAPLDNAGELALLGDAPLELGAHLGDVIEALATGRRLAGPEPPEPASCCGGSEPCLSEIRGQEQAKRALEIAAAGGHGLLLRGAPGAGKTLLARALPGLLPPLDPAEALQVARIRSAAGVVEPGATVLVRRPFRAPHHSASSAGLLGGGSPPRPGEVSLAHRGVLFLDELAEFDRRALQSLRQVLEDGTVVLARAEYRITFPARFQLVAAANPCPCGFFRSGVRDCRCDDGVVARYESRLSGPLLDRIDLHVAVRPLPFRSLSAPGGETSAAVASRVEAARQIQRRRLAAAGVFTNAEIPLAALDELVRATPEARQVLGAAVERLGLSARAAHRALRVARSVADLAEEPQVGPDAMAEAVGYRVEDRLGAPG